MAGTREDATLMVELAKWGSMMQLDEAMRAIWADDFDPETADVRDAPVQRTLLFNETLGTLVKNDLLDRELVYDWIWVEGIWARVGPAALRQRIFHSAVDWEYPEPQLTSVIAPAGHLSWPFSLAVIRDHRYSLPVIEDGGWHFSWLGTDRERRRKLDERTCHTEMPPEEWRAINDGMTYSAGLHVAPDAQVKAVEVDGTWPEYIRSRRCPPYWFRPRESR